MNAMPRHVLYSLMCAWGLMFSQGSVSAQGLLWSLPEEDGVWVRYFGDLKQVQERPDSARGPLEMRWQVELTIKVLGTEEAEYQGKSTRCRWLEFKYVVGHESATGIDAGPYGTRLYKVLVPEEGVKGKVQDDRNIPVIFVPVVQGFVRYGNRPVQPVKDHVLTFYPLLGLFAYYPTLKPADEDEKVALPQLGEVSARKYVGSELLQSSTSRSRNEGEIKVSSEIPFGWASYQAHIVREEKDRLAPVEAFKKHTELQIEMSAVEKGEGARSELNVMVEDASAPDEPATEKESATKPAEGEEAASKPEEGTPAETELESPVSDPAPKDE